PILIATGRKPVDPKVVVKTLTRGSGASGPKPTETGVLVAPGAEFPYVLPVDARTVLLAPTSAGRLNLTRIAESFGPKAVEGAGGSHALTVRLDVAVAKKLLGDQLPAGLLAAKSATLTADLPDDKTAKVALTLAFADTAGARQGVPAVEGLLKDVA